MKRILKGILDWALFLLSCLGPVADEAERDGLIRRGN
jgi:hypothetical protein